MTWMSLWSLGLEKPEEGTCESHTHLRTDQPLAAVGPGEIRICTVSNTVMVIPVGRQLRRVERGRLDSGAGLESGSTMGQK